MEELGHTVDVDGRCTTVDTADFEDADIIVATHTYGDGELQMRSLAFTKIWLTSTCVR